jgi:kynurenine formamidase
MSPFASAENVAMKNPRSSALLAGLLVSVAAPADTLDLSGYRLVDLGHPYGPDTLFWPSRPAPRFEVEKLAYGETPGGYFYSSNRFCSPEHGGTHLDAPIHFARDRRTVDQLPLEQLIAPAVRIDVREQAARDRSYRLQAADVRRFEEKWGTIRPGTIVLLQTGWSRHWPDRKAYFGSESTEDASGLDFPSYGDEAARLLVEERRVALLGVDTASIDSGRSRDFMVHRIAAAANVGGLENLANLDDLPETGFHVIALPMKIEGGSGGPVRVVALVPR